MHAWHLASDSGPWDVAEAHAVACSGELDYYSTVYQCPNCSAAFAEPEVADLHIVNCAGDETSGEERTASLETSDIDYAILDIMESKYEDFKKNDSKKEKNAIGRMWASFLVSPQKQLGRNGILFSTRSKDGKKTRVKGKPVVVV